MSANQRPSSKLVNHQVENPPKRKQDETWFPNPRRVDRFSKCISDGDQSCDDAPESEDLTFFLLNNEQSQGVDGYSDDDLPKPELQAMFSGKYRIYSRFHYLEAKL